MVAEGQIFGELSFILGLVAAASVVAETDCTVTVLNKAKLELLLFMEPRIAAAFYCNIAQLLRNRLLFAQSKG